MTMTTKTCSKCNCVKSLDDYYKNPRTKDKLTYWCKSCSIKRYKQWVKDNEVKVKARRKIRNAKPENKAYQKAYALMPENKQKKNISAKKWVSNNKSTHLTMVKRNQTSINPGIYQVRCLVDEMLYIGSSNEPYRRKNVHFSNLKPHNFKQSNEPLQYAMIEYGKDNFVFEMIEYVDISGLTKEESKLKLLEYEQVQIDKHPLDKLYNFKNCLKTQNK